MNLIHATCVEVGDVGVLLRGPSGSGKSDLALRLMDEGARLVSDDQVEISTADGQVLAAAPDTLDGLMEVRGVGVVSMPNMAQVRIELVVDLISVQDISRMPEPTYVILEDVKLPLFVMTPFEGSATAKLRLAARAVRHDIVRNK